MIVLDASAIVELVLVTQQGLWIAERIADPVLGLHAPYLADVEVAQALRRYARDGEVKVEEAAAALESFRALDIERHPHEPLLERVWALRDNLSAYDAVYLALAEALDTVLLTSDGKLARAPVTAGRIELVPDR